LRLQLSSLIRPPHATAVMALAALGVAALFDVPTHRHGLAAPGADPTLRDLVAVNNQVTAERAQQLGIGCVRLNYFTWNVVEPQPGQWNWAPPDQWAKQAQEAGLQVLALLGYTPPWAAAVPSAKAVSPPKNVSDWQSYVEQTVARYTSPPFNIRYFQVWNEPTQQAGFWAGTDQQYVDTVFLPAAKIIRQHGGYAVFGGWPLSNSLQELDSVLNYHNAWQSTDIIAVHYRPLSDMQTLYSHWVASGKCRGVWGTEMGYTAEPGAASSIYSRALYWALETGWNDPSEFKFFWYAATAVGNDGRYLMRYTATSTALSDEGMHLAVLNQVLGQGALSTFTQFSTTPPAGSGANAWAIGYQVGSSSVVINFLMDRAFFQAHASVQVNATLPGRPSRVQLISGLGKSWNLPNQGVGGRVQVNVPFQNGLDDCPKCKGVQGYLILDQ
jgi:hypothetical protein